MTKTLLNEDRASKNVSFARKYIMSVGYNQEQAQEVIDGIRHDIPNVRLAQYKFMLGVTRLYLNDQLPSANEIGQINKLLKYIASDAHVNEYDYNLNNEDFYTLSNKFQSVAQSDLDAKKTASSSPNRNAKKPQPAAAKTSPAAPARSPLLKKPRPRKPL